MPKNDKAQPVEVLSLEPSSKSLIAHIESDLPTVPNEKLVPFFVQADQITKRIKDLSSKVRAAMIERRDQGEPHGKDGNSRRFFADGYELILEYRQSTPIIEEKAEELLRKKKLWGDAINFEVEGGGAALQKFLRAHRKELTAAGVVLREVMDESKVKAMAEAGLISPDELKGILDLEAPPTYAAKGKYKLT